MDIPKTLLGVALILLAIFIAEVAIYSALEVLKYLKERRDG